MALKRWKENNGSSKLKLVECPLDWCREDLRNRKADSHLIKHTPEDFGLGELEVDRR